MHGRCNYTTPKKENPNLKEENTPNKTIPSLTCLQLTTPDTTKNDRFIPHRNTPQSQDIYSICRNERLLSKEIVDFTESEKDQLIYDTILEQNILNFPQTQFISNSKDPNQPLMHNFLSFGQKKENTRTSVFPEDESEEEGLLYSNRIIKQIQESRRIPKVPFKVLDAPGITDDFYTVC